MKATCEKPDCGETAVAQARFGEVAVARACSGHWPDLVESINQHVGKREPGLIMRPEGQNRETVSGASDG